MLIRRRIAVCLVGVLLSLFACAGEERRDKASEPVASLPPQPRGEPTPTLAPTATSVATSVPPTSQLSAIPPAVPSVENGAPTAAPVSGSPFHEGEATYYHATGRGNCSFDPVPGDMFVAAINQNDYAQAALCGAYLEVVGPSGTAVVRVVDRCPGCPSGHLDLSAQAFDQIASLADGRVSIRWRVVSPALAEPIRYHFKHNGSVWSAVQIRNHRNPIARVEYLTSNGEFEPLRREVNNYFVPAGQVGSPPYTFRVTDQFGHVLLDEGVEVGGGSAAGSGQFPSP